MRYSGLSLKPWGKQMLSEISNVVTAVATSLGTGILVFQLYQKLLSDSRRIQVKSGLYHRKRGTDFANVLLHVSAKERVFVSSVTCAGRRISFKREGPMVKEITQGFSVAPERRDIPLNLFVSPPPSGKEKLVFLFDVGGPFRQKEEFFCADFSVDRGLFSRDWPESQ